MPDPNEIAATIRDSILFEAHAALTPLAERASSAEVRQLARIQMRIIEAERGVAIITEIPPRHHP